MTKLNTKCRRAVIGLVAALIVALPASAQLPGLRALKDKGNAEDVWEVMGPPTWAILPSDRDPVYSGAPMTGITRSWFWPAEPGCPPVEVSFNERGVAEIVEDGGTLRRKPNPNCSARAVKELTPSDMRLCSKRPDAATACRP